MAEKIVAQHRMFGNDRFLLQMAIGAMPHDKIMKAIELYGTKVAPIVRKETARKAAGADRVTPDHAVRNDIRRCRFSARGRARHFAAAALR